MEIQDLIKNDTPDAWKNVDPDSEVAALLKAANSGSTEAAEQITDLERAEGEYTISRVAHQEGIDLP